MNPSAMRIGDRLWPRSDVNRCGIVNYGSKSLLKAAVISNIKCIA